LAHDEGHGLGFGLAHGGSGHGAPVAFVQKFMPRLMDQSHELLSLRLARQQGNLSAVADAKRGRDVFAVFEGDILRIEKPPSPAAFPDPIPSPVSRSHGFHQASGTIQPSAHTTDAFRDAEIGSVGKRLR
jgi:hypothetical protein